MMNFCSLKHFVEWGVLKGTSFPQTVVLTQKKFGPHKVDPTRFAGFFLREQQVAWVAAYQSSFAYARSLGQGFNLQNVEHCKNSQF